MTTPSTPQDRSPKYPRLTLEDAINRAQKIYTEAGKSPVDPDTLAKILGYTNAANGKAQACVSALLQYGLLSRDRKANRAGVSPLAIMIFHPVSDAQKSEAIRQAALTPPVFSEIHSEYGKCSESVLASHLVQKEFTPEGAAFAAACYKANSVLAKLDSIEEGAPNKPVTIAQSGLDSQPPLNDGDARSSGSQEQGVVHLAGTKKMLAQYTIPLGSNEATLVFTGQELSTDDFDALIDFVNFSKRQFERASKSARTTSPAQLPDQAPVTMDDPAFQ